MNTFWRDRRTFITGGTGLVGGWLVKRLREAGAEPVCLVRDWVPAAAADDSGHQDPSENRTGDAKHAASTLRTAKLFPR